MKKILVLVGLIVAFSASAFAGSGQKTITLAADQNSGSVVATYANSQVDTIIINREGSASGISFSCHWKDSVLLGTTVGAAVRRLVDGVMVPLIGGDSLSLWSNFAGTTDGAVGSTTFANGNSNVGTITLAPLTDAYVIILKYAASGNGVTTPTVVYKANKVFSRR